MRPEGRHALLLGALIVTVVTALALCLAPVLPLGGTIVPLAALVALFFGVQYAVFRMIGLRSAADEETPRSAPDDDAEGEAESEDEAGTWRG